MGRIEKEFKFISNMVLHPMCCREKPIEEHW